MKKCVICILVMLILCNIAAVPVSAAHGVCFVDGDGDGLCDNRVECALIGMCRHRDCEADCGGFVDAEKDGICDNRGQGIGCGRGDRAGSCGSYGSPGQRRHRRGK